VRVGFCPTKKNEKDLGGTGGGERVCWGADRELPRCYIKSSGEARFSRGTGALKWRESGRSKKKRGYGDSADLSKRVKGIRPPWTLNEKKKEGKNQGHTG